MAWSEHTTCQESQLSTNNLGFISSKAVNAHGTPCIVDADLHYTQCVIVSTLQSQAAIDTVSNGSGHI